jgi:hypothetical protein
MKCLAFAQVLAAVSTFPQTAAPQPSSIFALEDGTPVRPRLGRTLSSEDAHVGDRVDFDVLEEVRVNDILVIRKGALVLATITAAEPKKRMARGGKLGINIDDVKLVSGEKVALRAVKDVKGGGHTGAMVGGMVATGILFFPAAPFFLFMHGHEITIPKGTETTAYVNGNARLDARNFQPGAGEVTTVPVADNKNSSVPPQVSSPADQTAPQVTTPADQSDSKSDWTQKYWPKQQPKQEQKQSPPK